MLFSFYILWPLKLKSLPLYTTTQSCQLQSSICLAFLLRCKRGVRRVGKYFFITFDNIYHTFHIAWQNYTLLFRTVQHELCNKEKLGISGPHAAKTAINLLFGLAAGIIHLPHLPHVSSPPQRWDWAAKSPFQRSWWFCIDFTVCFITNVHWSGNRLLLAFLELGRPSDLRWCVWIKTLFSIPLWSHF